MMAPFAWPLGRRFCFGHPHCLGLAAGFLSLCAALIVPTTTWADGLVLEGSKLSWTAEAPSFWIGGTAQRIERVLAKTVGTDRTSQDIRTLMREMLPEAKGLDALLFHMDVTGTETKTMSSLRINVAPGSFRQLADSTDRQAVFERFAQSRLETYAQGTKVELTQHHVGVTGGREAYEGIFVFTLPSGGKVYEVRHLVAYDPGLTHLFALRADSVKFQARYDDLKAILKSLKYVFGGGKLPWKLSCRLDGLAATLRF